MPTTNRYANTPENPPNQTTKHSHTPKPNQTTNQPNPPPPKKKQTHTDRLCDLLAEPPHPLPLPRREGRGVEQLHIVPGDGPLLHLAGWVTCMRGFLYVYVSPIFLYSCHTYMYRLTQTLFRTHTFTTTNNRAGLLPQGVPARHPRRLGPEQHPRGAVSQVSDGHTYVCLCVCV